MLREMLVVVEVAVKRLLRAMLVVVEVAVKRLLGAMLVVVVVVVGGWSKITIAKEKHYLKDHSPDNTNNSL